mmetsp:Transcript_11094/g.18602  ORF Transcript_11094/g.18602 Transcript_11094/m.18602 type:complete len:80 (+) Transcript_11094:591-830(+)
MEVLSSVGLIFGDTVGELPFMPVGNRLTYLSYSIDMLLSICSVVKLYLVFRALLLNAADLKLRSRAQFTYEREKQLYFE